MAAKNLKIKFGIFLMVFSGVFFGASLIFPMLGLPVKTKVYAVTTSIVLMEVSFWTGGFLVGKELFKKYKALLNPKNWFNKAEPDKME